MCEPHDFPPRTMDRHQGQRETHQIDGNDSAIAARKRLHVARTGCGLVHARIHEQRRAIAAQDAPTTGDRINRHERVMI